MLGTTLGMMLANVPVVLLGEAARALPVRLAHLVVLAARAALGGARRLGRDLGLPG